MSDVRFGTAGLRAPMGDGPGRFNTALVARASYGLATYLTVNQIPGPVVVGFDARHGSARFAAEAAAVLRAAGRPTLLMPRELPTPVLAFAVRHLRAAAGVMITASHNPASDNGYKVYLADGSQIAPPADAAMEAAIAAAPADVPRADAPGELVSEDLVEAYLARTVSLVPADATRTSPRVAYTPLHGVAGATFRQAWERAGFAPYAEVAEQAAPDPDFPTVAFPNPEEPGALDLAAATAARVDADLVLAHDPDGDRCAVMIRDGDGYRALSGDEVGALLAEHLLSSGRIPPDGVLATTIVSSPLLDRIAAAHGRRCVRTLTGFKWLARVPGVAYAYEEALGYCVDPGGVRDKDGISAALLIAEMAAAVPLGERLDALAQRYGVHVSAPRSIRTDDPEQAGTALRRLLDAPPRHLAGVPVDDVQDLSAPDTGLPPTTGVRVTAGAITAVVRPSGTEPKLKIYLYVSGESPPVHPDRERAGLAEQLELAGRELCNVLVGMRESERG